MAEPIQTAFKVDQELLNDFDAVLDGSRLNRSIVLRAAMMRCVERRDVSWLLVPSKREERGEREG